MMTFKRGIKAQTKPIRGHEIIIFFFARAIVTFSMHSKPQTMANFENIAE